MSTITQENTEITNRKYSMNIDYIYDCFEQKIEQLLYYLIKLNAFAIFTEEIINNIINDGIGTINRELRPKNILTLTIKYKIYLVLSFKIMELINDIN